MSEPISPRLEARCWSCAAVYDAGSALVCPSCGKVVPPHPHAGPFGRLGVEPPRFAVDERELERAWMQRSRQVHPDRFASKSPEERRYAVEQTAALNDALRAVKDRYDRALWLVRSRGIEVNRLDQTLLMTLMEARERAEESSDERAAVVDESTRRFAAVADGLGALLANLDDTNALQRAARALAEMKTLARLVSDLGGGRLIGTLEER